MRNLLILFVFITTTLSLAAQNKFYFGSDLSYVNEMEDCGAVFKEAGQPKDVYKIFADHKTNLARFRLWHTPSFYDTLNAGVRYSDLQDVRMGILRAKSVGMDVLLDFHFSDFWADPSRQWIPKAWEAHANNLPVLKDSLYNYVYQTLINLHNDNLLPEMVQIGNETNRGIMLTPAVNAAGWSLDWSRNAPLFKRAIEAVRAVEAITGKKIRVSLHIADPADTGWLMQAFWNNGVRDFDVIGMSYYWAWHMPVTIAQTGQIITQLRSTYPGKSVMIFETGYIWTQASNDQASNIISETHPNYAPASPDAQRRWLIDLTQEVINKGGEGVMYWEPAWVSTSCRTPWGKGSHQEHATFFDFNNNMLPAGGMIWPQHPFTNLTEIDESEKHQNPRFWVDMQSGSGQATIHADNFGSVKQAKLHIFNSLGQLVTETEIPIFQGTSDVTIPITRLNSGIYFFVLTDTMQIRVVEKVIFNGKW
jgi:arabinogalactan endo-1,4-beta-galactosidase